jgi:hypothetical protein
MCDLLVENEDKLRTQQVQCDADVDVDRATITAACCPSNRNLENVHHYEVKIHSVSVRYDDQVPPRMTSFDYEGNNVYIRYLSIFIFFYAPYSTYMN